MAHLPNKHLPEQLQNKYKTGVLIGALALGGMTTLMSGDPLVGAVLANIGYGVGGNVVHDKLNEVCQHLAAKNTDQVLYNHDLQQAFARAIPHALEHTKAAVLQHIPSDRRGSIDRIFERLHALTVSDIQPAIMDIADDEELKQQVYHGDTATNIVGFLHEIVKLETAMDMDVLHLLEHFPKHFERELLTAFHEELKTDHKANTAFNTMMHEGREAILQMLRQDAAVIKADTQAIRLQLEKLDMAMVRTEIFERAIQKATVNIDQRLAIIEQLLQELVERMDNTPPPLPKFLTDLPPHPPVFIGREQAMKAVEQGLQNNNLLLLVNGMGGIGKTTVAQAYVRKHIDRYDHIIWLRHLTDLPQAFIHGLTHIPPDWQLQAKEPPQDYLQRILQKIREVPGNNILVIDGWDDTEEINTYLPSLNLPNWTLLTTTRSQVADFPRYELGKLDEANAIQLFLKHAPHTAKDKKLPELLQHIGYHTLMIELLAKTLTANPFLKNVGELLDLLQAHQWQDEELQMDIKTRHSEAEAPIYQHLIATFKAAQLNEHEKWLLLQFAVLPSLPIKSTELYGWLQLKKEDRKRYLDTLKSVWRKGWIEQVEAHTYQAHPVVRVALREQLKPDGENCKELVNSFGALLDVTVEDSALDKVIFMPYGVALFHHVQGQNKYMSTLFTNVACIYHVLGNVSQALKFQKKAFDIAKAIVKSHPLALATCCNNLASFYYTLKNIEVAISYQQKSVEIFETIYEPPHSSLATSYNNLACLYNALKDYSNALELQQKAIDIQKAIFGTKHRSLAISYNNLADIFKNLGKLNKAIELQKQAINIHLDTTDSHPDSLATYYNNIATLYRLLENFPKALTFQNKVIKIQETTFNKNYPYLGTSYRNLSQIYKALGDLPKAVAFIQKAIDIQVAVFGLEHNSLAISYQYMATIYIDLKDFSTAKNYINKAVAIFQHNFPNGHPNLTKALESQARIDEQLA